MSLAEVTEMPAGDTAPRLALQRFRLDFACLEHKPPRHPGVDWYAALRRHVRRLGKRRGELPSPGDELFASTTHSPFVLREVPGGTQGIQLHLTVTGRASHYAPLLLQGLSDAARSEHGVGGRHLRLTGITQQHARYRHALIRDGRLQRPYPPSVPQIPRLQKGTLVITIDSPMRLRYRDLELGAGDIHFPHFVHGLYKRVRRMQGLQGNAGLPEPAEIGSEGGETFLQWVEDSRRLKRSEPPLRIAGAVGEIHIPMEAAAAHWPLLWLGQCLHVGSGAALGLGHYRLRLKA